MRRALGLAFCFALGLQRLWAGTGATAAGFLQEDMNARMVGIGGAFSAAAQGTEAIFTNPAGIVRARRPEVNTSYATAQNQSHHALLLYAHPFELGGVRASVGGAFNYYSAGRIDIYTSNGYSQTLKAEEGLEAGLSLSIQPLSMLSIGITPKFIRSKLVEQYTASGYGVDMGVMAYLFPQFGDRLVLGGAVQNLGTKLKYRAAESDLPQTMSFGIAGIPWDSPSAGSLLLTVQGDRAKGEDPRYRLGYEYAFGRHSARAFFLRGGVRLRADDEFSMGIGFREKSISFDYAFLSNGDLEKTHKITMIFRFGTKDWGGKEDPERYIFIQKEDGKPENPVLIQDKQGKDEGEYYMMEKELEKENIKDE